MVSFIFYSDMLMDVASMSIRTTENAKVIDEI